LKGEFEWKDFKRDIKEKNLQIQDLMQLNTQSRALLEKQTHQLSLNHEQYETHWMKWGKDMHFKITKSKHCDLKPNSLRNFLEKRLLNIHETKKYPKTLIGRTMIPLMILTMSMMQLKNKLIPSSFNAPRNNV
jgi:hypothetical protein